MGKESGDYAVDLYKQFGSGSKSANSGGSAGSAAEHKTALKLDKGWKRDTTKLVAGDAGRAMVPSVAAGELRAGNDARRDAGEHTLADRGVTLSDSRRAGDRQSRGRSSPMDLVESSF